MAQSVSEESPRQVANKSRKSALLKAIRMALNIESAAVRHNTQTFNRNKYRAVAGLADYDALKDLARATKERAIENLPALVHQLKEVVEARGGNVFLAANGEEANNYIRDVCTRHNAKLVVKGKSMTSEETRLNHVLQDAGIEVAESDLAEFILQVADEQPSHVIAPAIHYSRERITALFKRKFNTDLPLDTGEDLTKFAREILREKFLRADVGISGANMIVAETGTLMLVESEGNIRMSTMLPSVHIAIAGVEKIIPTREDLVPFIELLAASGTGQPLTSYTSLLSPPLKVPPIAFYGRTAGPREFHLVLLDNGRLKMRDDPVFRETLYCIRCSACLNSCANFQTVGGHAFGGETYSGGIGGSWEAGTGKLENARFNELCTGCSRCINNCPVRIDIPWLNDNLRERLSKAEPPSLTTTAFGLATGTQGDDTKASLQKQFFANYHVFAKFGTMLAPIVNRVSSSGFGRSMMEKVVGLDHRRELQPFPEKAWEELYRRRDHAAHEAKHGRAVVFADVFTNYGSPERGMATVEILESAGVDVVLSRVISGGRAALSQGMITTAKHQARETAEELERYIDDGREVVVVEPSELALFRLDYRHLLDHERFSRLRRHSFEAVEYLWRVLQENKLDPRQFYRAELAPFGKRIFYHSHCQQKTTHSDTPTQELLRAIGFDVATSQVECCGMAGSFGYKTEYYDLSMAVGQDLFAQVKAADQGGERQVVVSGTSCHEQVHDGMHRSVLHPMEVLSACRVPANGTHPTHV